MRTCLGLLIAVLPFLSGCVKPIDDDGGGGSGGGGGGGTEPKTFICSGRLTDASTHAVIKDVSLSIFTGAGTWNDYLNAALTLVVVDQMKTDGGGVANFSFIDNQTYTGYFLGCTSLPPGYQRYVRVNGANYDLAYITGPFTDQDSDHLHVYDKQFYTLEIYPVASYRFTLPTLTAEQKKCKLVLELPYWHGATFTEEYVLNNADDLTRLKSIRRLAAANYAKGEFQLMRDTIVSQGSFNTFCVPHDTTDVLLSL